MTEDEGARGDRRWANIAELAFSQAERFRDRAAVVDGDVELTFADLARRSETVARALLALGIERGDRIAIWAPNIWEWIVVALGVHGVGAALVPINTRYRGHEASYILAKSGARVLFTLRGFLDTDYPALLREASAGFAGSIVLLRGEAEEGEKSFVSFLEGADRVSVAEAVERRATVGTHDRSDILFTSGTTGQPKGAVTTHGQSLRAFSDWSHVVGLRAEDRYLVVAPFFHCFGYKAGWLAALMTGSTVYPQAVFDVDAVLRRIANDRINVLPGPPALYQSMLGHRCLKDFDLSSLRLAVTGAAVIPTELVARMRLELGFKTVITGYGLTESTGIATMCRFDDDDETIARTSGRAIPGVEVRVVDDHGQELPRGKPGEVWIRGYNVMTEYFGEAAETAQAITPDGFLRTGDIGVMDERGYLRITDRKKDMFIVGGFNAYPAEVENALLTCTDIVHAAVIGIPDDRLGEVGMAFVVLRPGSLLREAEIIEYCRARLANFKVPRRVAIVDDLPRNASGKVQKFKLRDA